VKPDRSLACRDYCHVLVPRCEARATGRSITFGRRPNVPTRSRACRYVANTGGRPTRTLAVVCSERVSRRGRPCGPTRRRSRPRSHP
jgi:hypothetical protein